MMLDDIKEVLNEVANDQEVFRDLAKIYMNLFKALQNAGFTSDEAMRIIEAHGMKLNG